MNTQNITKIAIVGASGRMGGALIRLSVANPKTALVGATARPSSTALDTDAGTSAGIDSLGIPITDDLNTAFANADVIIDVTPKGSTEHHLNIARQHNTKMVIGSTGLSDTEEQHIAHTAQYIPIVYTSNFSIGMNTLFAVCEHISPILSADKFQVHIDETHHIHKQDAPSGTALSLGKYVASGRKQDFTSVYKYQSERQTDADITFTDNRRGEVIGDHTVSFESVLESLHLTHTAHKREVFADGAICASIWLNDNKPNGLYTMRDVLGLNL